MSSSLEYLPLFIFVLTLTYKKKKEKQLKKTQQQKECFDVGERMLHQPLCHIMYGDWARGWLLHTGSHPGVPRATGAAFLRTSGRSTLGS